MNTIEYNRQPLGIGAVMIVGIEYARRLSHVRPLKRRIPCKGALKLWTMDAALSDAVRKAF